MADRRTELDRAVDAAIAEGRRNGTARDVVIETSYGPVDAVEFDMMPVVDGYDRKVEQLVKNPKRRKR
jgi:hypothetical protein